MLNWKLLTAFEAAARHRNFTQAARELNVQQPAISRRIAELERELGAMLFLRTRPHAKLTEAGETLFQAVSNSTFQVRVAIDQIRIRSDQNAVTVNTTIGFASCYLMQRLADFRGQNPEVTVELVSRDQNDAYGADLAEILIVFEAPDRLPGIRSAKIFGEELVPVARPGCYAAVQNDMGRLVEQPLLHLASGIHGDDWTRYLAGTGIVAPPYQSDRRYTSFMVCLQAALNGEGVMLGWERLMQTQFDLGQLERVATRSVRSDRGYFACLTGRARSNDAAVKLFDWLSELEP
ncbi:MAG: LysR family transcriptional regulator [Pseudomonadota bacterium]